jgi:Putative MetA-pathway of phenol degradation
MAKIWFTVIFVSLSQIGDAQEKIDTDRPDQTESAVLIPKNYFQAEIGFNREMNKGLSTLNHPTALWKYGLHKRLELRLVTEFVSEERESLVPGDNKINTGLRPVEIGSKIALWEEKGWLPKTSFIVHVTIPAFSSKEFKTSYAFPNFRFTMAHTLSEKVGIGYNLGTEWDGMSHMPYWVYTFSPGFNLSEKWYGYIELFGAIRKNEHPHHSIDGGFAYYISNDIKIDLSGGMGITKAATDEYVAIGFSFRCNTKFKK